MYAHVCINDHVHTNNREYVCVYIYTYIYIYIYATTPLRYLPFLYFVCFWL